MRLSTLLATVLAMAGLAVAGPCKPSAPSSVSSSSPSPSPSIATGADGCTYKPTANLMETHALINPLDPRWDLTASSQYATYTVGSCGTSSQASTNCVTYAAANPEEPLLYHIYFTYSFSEAVQGNTYVFSFDVAQDDNSSNSVRIYTSNTFTLQTYTLTTPNAVVPASLAMTASTAGTQFIVEVQSVEPSTSITFSNFAITQTACV
ncbi:hypothetical protein SEUCBS140593_007978 [Sporothrix eucalyptigena]|uniref:Uncharacterized protein n=1 Tax=Sporothrix eucalyptigena TaxID=1812306 RepID=A0ABP0CHN9_9PEZI